ncbi:nuclear transport factor 2 family protein [Massilia sp. P8910]|uniref:nuclear transport factor 2 family protein n=1 Tax=Massilia antarctica TaxID=2765360 RepID=UPI001E46D913|nr:nuclear transport factor 2 family protein [Massilia antarctica]MCE3608168.1 nuclear transport factor 2 family protein [Massilia antarctica]
MHDKEAQDHIIALEEQLRLAMLAVDVDGLDRLIAPGLLFTTHMGEVIGKWQDLDMHRSGLLKFRAIAAAERQVVADARLGVMSARMNLVGSFGGGAVRSRPALHPHLARAGRRRSVANHRRPHESRLSWQAGLTRRRS